MRTTVAFALALASLAAGCLAGPGPGPEGPPVAPIAPANDSARAETAGFVLPPPPEQCAEPYDCSDARRDDPALPTFERFEKKVRLSAFATSGSLDFAPGFPWRAYRLEAWTETAGEGLHAARALSLYHPHALLVGRSEGVGRLVVAANSTAMAGDGSPFRLQVDAPVPVASDEVLTLVAEVRYDDAPAPTVRLAQGSGYVGFRDVDDHDVALWSAADALVVRVLVVDDARLIAPDHAFALAAPDGSVAASAGPWGGELRVERPTPGLWTLRATGGNDPLGGVTFGFEAVALLPAAPPHAVAAPEPRPID